MTQESAPPRALYLQAKQHVKNRILSGEWQPGDAIPSENQLVRSLGMSRMTVNRALRELTGEGYIERISGVGSFVAQRKAQSNLLKIANIADEIEARGHRYRCEVLHLGREPASLQVATALSIATGSSVAHVCCVHYEEGVPVQYEDRWVNPAIVPDFADQHFDDSLQPSVYLLNSIPAEEIEHVVDATLPTPDEAAALNIEASEPCLELMRRTWSRSQVVTWVRFLHPSSRYRLGSRFEADRFNRSS
ncbi:histidine utilization repressor [Salinisphaera sp. SPP-AMP-43]|uniref:histidine utilization repressor n=1 Tax=Salinisphaera sp. SPP-AMP-43 TaxID=3121288 RepID=UPI003C6DDF5B